MLTPTAAATPLTSTAPATVTATTPTASLWQIGCLISGIEVRLDWWLDRTTGTNSMSVELSWDGGASWTAMKTDTTETTSRAHGRSWAAAPTRGGGAGRLRS